MSQTITDAKGRSIEVVKRSSLDLRRWMRNVGKAADIQVWMGEAVLAIHAVTIDGVPVPMPQTADATDVLVDKLGRHGLEAIATWWNEDHEAEEARNADLVDAAKN